MTDHHDSRPAATLQRKPGTSRPVEPGCTRRAFMAGASAFLAGAATIGGALPALATEETIGEKIDRLTQELSEAMDEFQGGRFFAVVAGGARVSLHPESRFKLVRKPLNDQHRLDMAAMEFQEAYEGVHEDVESWHVVRDARLQVRLLVPVLVTPPVEWSGDGVYEVVDGDARPPLWITREPHYDDGDERWFRISTGWDGPEERPDFCCPERNLPKIVRKIAAGAVL